MTRTSLAVVFAICFVTALVPPLAAQTAVGRGAGSSYGGGGLGAAAVGSGAGGANAPTARDFNTSLKPSLETGSPSAEDLAKAVRPAEPAPAAAQAVQVAPPAANEAAAPDGGGADCVCQNGQPADSAGLCWIDGQEQGWRQERCQ